MRTKLFLSLLFIAIITGLTASAQRLYPVSGPTATQGPPPLFTAKITRGGAANKHSGGAGKITLTQVNGESFQGTWTTAIASYANAKTVGTPAAVPPQPNLAFVWDSVYGPGFFAANILGTTRLGQAIANGSQGTILQLEFYEDHLKSSVDNHFGVAIDSRGNIYKVVL